MLTETAIGIGILFLILYLGVPYLQAYQRRKELERKHHARKPRVVREETVR